MKAQRFDLFEVLRGAFEDDRFERVNKGQPGADIRHTVMLNGQECGKILYDSKNHKGWRWEFVTKLALTSFPTTQITQILFATRKFPEGQAAGARA